MCTGLGEGACVVGGRGNEVVGDMLNADGPCDDDDNSSAEERRRSSGG
jgi:hypothetical protein